MISVTAMFLCMVIIMGTEGMAAERGNHIKSRGSVEFENGKVFLTADDLHYLAKEVDELEHLFKINTIDSLNSIGTYFLADGTPVQNKYQNQMEQNEDKLKIDLNSILKGIQTSQSISSIYGIQAENKEGEGLYYVDEAARNAQNHKNITTIDTGLPLTYKEAGEENISAGCAAWVNGRLIMGNGGDNNVSYQSGYDKGVADGLKQALNLVQVEYIYHEHQGDSSLEGGCYGITKATQNVICGCNSYVYTEDEYGTSTCSNCYHNHGEGTCDYKTGEAVYDTISLVCGKTENDIEKAIITY